MKKIVELIKRLFGVAEVTAKKIETIVVEAETKAEAEIHEVEKAVEATVKKAKAPRKPRVKKEVK